MVERMYVGKKPRRRGGFGTAQVLAAIALVAAVAVAVAVYAYWFLLVKPDRSGVVPGKPIEVTVAKGSSSASIAKQLSDEGVVSNAFAFRLDARRAGIDAQLKPGTYSLATGMPDAMVLEKLRKGPDIVYYDVTIPEGFTARQIAARFAKRAGVSEEEMLALVTAGAPQFVGTHPYLANAYGGSLEGYLFPATYRVKKGTKSTAIVEMMLKEFDQQISRVDMSYAKSKNLTLPDVVIIGSILEREASVADERPLVASVIYNRMKIGMRLQLCATVLYQMPPGTNKLTNEDTRKDGPYNTYVRLGLPVGPISNPGLASLRAAAAPKETKYLYYVLTGKDGSQTFCATYDEFLKAKQKNHQVFGN
jgi:UPF0755 protein